jgi:predicted RNase H-like nuclease (RuvC/YqgF family)
MHYAVQKEDILKQRFIKKYGVDAYIELANFTENFSFDPVKFKESNERGIKRKERIEELEQQLYQSNKERAELEEKLSHQTQIMDAMTKTSQNNYKLTQQVKDIEQQLNQSNKERAELEIAVKALEFYASEHSWAHKGCHGGSSGHRYRIITDDRNEISPEWGGLLVGGKRAREALAKINQK